MLVVGSNILVVPEDRGVNEDLTLKCNVNRRLMS